MPGGLPTGVVTFLLTDVEGSTALWERRRDVMGQALALHDALIESAVTQAGGRVLKARGEGDSTFSVFERPTQAVRAAIDARRALQTAAWPDGCRLEVRFSVHAGEVEERDGDYYGNAVNRAARIRGLAVGDQILVSQAASEMVADHLPDDALLVDMGEHELKGLSRPERIRALVDSSRPVHEAIGGFCPYKGLLAFQTDDEGVFFGREATVARLLSRLFERRLVVVVGASGSGKSSVVRAGVLAAFRRGEIPGGRDWSTVIVTPGEHPLAQLERELAGDTSAHRVIAVDQMEELFTACNDPAERAAFVERLLNADEGTLVIGALRADFFGHCASVPGLAAALSDATVLLGPMDESELRRAIESPSEIAGLRLEPGLVDVMLNDLGREPGALPLLSHALLETWRRRTGKSLTLTGYQDSGGVRGAIAHTAEGVWNDDLSESDRAIARRIFLRLTEPGEGTEDTRRRVRRAELETGDDASETERVLGLLADRRLVTVDDDTAEVAHEALIREWPRLRSWLDDDREGLRIHRHLTHAADDWDALGRSESELYRGPRLAAAREWLARDEHAQLNVLEAAFVDASAAREQAEIDEEAERVAARERATRRLQRLLVATAVVLVVALIAGAAAFTQRRRADRNAGRARAVTRAAEVDRAIAESEAVLGRDRTLAALLAVQARRLRPDAAANGAVLSAVRAEPRLRFTLAGGFAGYAWMAAFPDSRRIAVLSRDGLDVWDLKARTRVASLKLTDARGVAVSADGKRIATGDSTGKVTFRDAATLQPVGVTLDTGAAVTHLTFGPFDKTIAVAGGVVESPDPITPATTPRVWDVARGRAIAALTGHMNSVNAIAMSHDGRLFATGGNDGLVLLHDATTYRQVGAPISLGEDIYSLEFSTDDSQLAAGYAYTSAKRGGALIDVARRSVSESLGDGTVSSAGYAANGHEVVVAGDAVDVFDSRTRAPTTDQLQTQHGPAQIAYIDGTGLVLSGFDGTVSVWDLHGDSPLATRVRIGARAGGIYSPDGRRLLVSANDGTARLFTMPEQQLVATFTTSTGQRIESPLATPTAFSPDGGTIAVGDLFGRVRLFDGHTGAPRGAAIVVDSAQVPYSTIDAVIFSPDGRTLVTTGLLNAKNGAHLVDVATGKVTAFDPPVPRALVASFRPDGKQLAVASGAGGGAIYNFANGRVTPAGPLPSNVKAEGVAYSPDGRLIAIASQDGTLTFFAADSLKQIGSPLSLSSTILANMEFTPDGRLLLAQDLAGNQHLVDVRERARVGAPFVGSDTKPAQFGVAAFAPNGSRMVLPSPDKTLIWSLDTELWARVACRQAGRSLTRAEWDKYFASAGAYQVTCP